MGGPEFSRLEKAAALPYNGIQLGRCGQHVLQRNAKLEQLRPHVTRLEIVESDPSLTHVALIGTLDAAGVYAVENQFKDYVESRRLPTLVDMSGVTGISSVGMRMLIRSLKVLRDNGVKMALLRPHGFVEDALRTACLDQVMIIVRDETLARARLLDK
jgi:anti-anti-sigma factor